VSAAAFLSTCFAVHGYGAYICGEETALSNRWKEKKGRPRSSRRFQQYGLYGKPTDQQH